MAARFVTGYLYDPSVDEGASGADAGTRLAGAGATHAWVQVYLPGAGWVEFDPTNGLVGGAHLIRVAVARDPRQAIPLSGSYRGFASDFVEMLGPGTYWRLDPLFRLRAEKFALANTRFEHRLADFLLKAEPEVVAREFHVVELGPAEAGLRFANGVLAEVLAPNTRRLYWRGYIDLRFERNDISEHFGVDATLAPHHRGAAVAGRPLFDPQSAAGHVQARGDRGRARSALCRTRQLRLLPSGDRRRGWAEARVRAGGRGRP